jgi:SP family sugar:H+ symporter-like MFS transporter
MDSGKEKLDVADSHVPFLTWRSLLLGAFVSVGGIIFGYDTGQISGFLEMNDFKRRFGQLGDDGRYTFSNVRSGLIVSLVRTNQLVLDKSSYMRVQRISDDKHVDSCPLALC